MGLLYDNLFSKLNISAFPFLQTFEIPVHKVITLQQRRLLATSGVGVGVCSAALLAPSPVFAFVKRKNSCLSLKIFSLPGVKVRSGAIWVSAFFTFTACAAITFAFSE